MSVKRFCCILKFHMNQIDKFRCNILKIQLGYILIRLLHDK